MEGVVVIHTGNDANMSYSATSRTSLEEHQVAWLKVILLHAYAITDLTS